MIAGSSRHMAVGLNVSTRTVAGELPVIGLHVGARAIAG
jgi:hypothetical protein